MEKKEYKCKGMYGYYRHKGDNRVIEYLIVDGNKFWSDEYVQQELDKAREEGTFTKEELMEIKKWREIVDEEFWEDEDCFSLEEKISNLLT